LEKPEETHDLTLEAYEEHAVVKTLLAELSVATSTDNEWQANAKVLRENVEHHVEEEENELFDKADDVLSDEQIEALGQQMKRKKRASRHGRSLAQTERLRLKRKESFHPSGVRWTWIEIDYLEVEACEKRSSQNGKGHQ